MSEGHREQKTSIVLVYPQDGDMLNEYDGVVRDGCLYIRVRLSGPEGSRLTVNGRITEQMDRNYYAEIGLDGYRNTIEIVDEATGYSEQATVYWLRNAMNKYRLSVDDNIWFLRDIAANSHVYESIFDNPYLNVYKHLHDTYGTKVHLNLFYRTDGFDLSQMPDKYKQEWQDHSHWLRLTFHAMQENPGMPYKDAGPEVILPDCDQVTREIVRFAGEELLDSATTIHWGEATREGCVALHQYGFRTLAGYFTFAGEKPSVSYYLDHSRVEHLNNRDFWKDHSTDLVFAKIDLVLDRTRLEDVVPSLEDIRARVHEAGFLELMVHEQYFYPDYTAYQPDYREKLVTAVKWATDNGYRPAFLSECLEE